MPSVKKASFMLIIGFIIASLILHPVCSATAQQALTVAAVLSCPLKNVVKAFTEITELPAQELEICIASLTELILQGKKEAVSGFIEESSGGTKQPLPIEQISFLHTTLSQAVKDSTRIHGESRTKALFTETPSEFGETRIPALSRTVATAQTLINLLKKYTDGNAFLSSVAKGSSASRLLKAGAAHLISQHIPYTSLLRGIAGAWTTARQEISSRKSHDTTEDELIQSSPLTHIAHTIALEKVIKLFYVMYSPYSHPCDRMQALFLVNHLQLLGSTGRQFRSFVAHLNHDYFSEKGTLHDYDPTRGATTEPRQILRFVNFLKKVCISKEHYLRSLLEGSTYGITTLQEQYFEAQQKTWKRKKESTLAHYSHEIIKGIVGYDLSTKKVDPSIVCSAKPNRDLIKLIKLCEVDHSEEPDEKTVISLSSARTLVAQCKRAHHSHTCNTAQYMQRYYNDAFSRFPLALRRVLNQRSP